MYIDRYGIITKKVKAFGCTSRGQAARLGKAILFAEQHESEVVTFATSIDSGAVVRPGAVIEIADPVRSGIRRGGRIKSATLNTITVDDFTETDLSTDNNPKVSVIMPDGTVESKDVSGDILNGVIPLAGNLSAVPNANSVWMLENDTISSQQFRVMSVEEKDGINYGISALAYVKEKYDFIEDGTAIPTQVISSLNLLKNPIFVPKYINEINYLKKKYK